MNAITFLAAAAIVVGVVLAVRSGRKKKTDWAALQLVAEVFGVSQAKDWFAEKTGGNTAGKMLLVAWLTPEIRRELAVSGENLDPDHYLVLAVLGADKKTQTYQLVNFDRLEDGLRQLLTENGGKVIIAY